MRIDIREKNERLDEIRFTDNDAIQLNWGAFGVYSINIVESGGGGEYCTFDIDDVKNLIKALERALLEAKRE